jgi:hypothetical protein
MATIKNLSTTNVGENVMKQEPLYAVGGNINQYNHMENIMEIP